jgi:hypothetical protein
VIVTDLGGRLAGMVTPRVLADLRRILRNAHRGSVVRDRSATPVGSLPDER